jgi:phosphoserine phosphatase
MKVEMIIFDMDGVLFEGRNFWLDLHDRYNTREEALNLAKNFLYTERESDYTYLSKRTAQTLWYGKSSSDYYKLIEDRKYQPGVFKLFDYIHSKNIKTAIISSGSYNLALRAQRDLGINEILANRLIINDLSLIEDVDVMVPDNKKDKVGKKLMWRLKISSNDVAFIGDTNSDISLAKIVGLPISYNSTSEKLKNVCEFTLEYGELEKIIDILSAVNKV